MRTVEATPYETYYAHCPCPHCPGVVADLTGNNPVFHGLGYEVVKCDICYKEFKVEY